MPRARSTGNDDSEGARIAAPSSGGFGYVRGWARAARRLLALLILAFALLGAAAAQAQPRITNVSPSSGPPGTTVTITGTGFTGATSVSLGGNASFTVVSDSQIKATAPNSCSSNGLVGVTTPAGLATGIFNCFQPLTITSVAPNTGSTAGGTTVVITGTGFTAIRSVKFGGVEATGYTVNSLTQITAVTPAHAAGVVDVSVRSIAGAGTVTSAGAFTYVASSGTTASTPTSASTSSSATTTPADSTNLKNLQNSTTPMVTAVSTQAATSNVTAAITEGFRGAGSPFTFAGGGLRFAYAGEPATKRESDAFAAMAAADYTLRPGWSIWGQISGTGWNSSANAGSISGGQLNGMGGITRVLSSTFLVGGLVGYENYDYTIGAVNGGLKGGGWTAGGYLGWMVKPKLRFDALLSHSSIVYESRSGGASADIPASRWIASGTLTGQTEVSVFNVEPSISAYAVMERQDSYTDSLGTAQAGRSFTAGRASGGTKVGYPYELDSTVTLEPYVGLYADYYYSNDSSIAVTGLGSQAVLTGWAARFTGGLGVEFKGGQRAAIGGEIGGFGTEHRIWTLRGKVELPF